MRRTVLIVSMIFVGAAVLAEARIAIPQFTCDNYKCAKRLMR